MSNYWTTQHVAALAPDVSSLKAGEKLSQPHKWQNLGQADSVIWGEIKGSGKNPYQTAIVLDEPVFKCSCPSRKFPCKHGIALALVYAASPDQLLTAEPLSWVQEWLDKRGQRAQKKAEKAAAAEQPVDEATLQKREAAQQKRAAAREDKVSAGIEDLQRWLSDLIRQGLANSDDVQWSRMAERMVDAQAPGVARRLQNARDARYQGGAWQEQQLAEVACLHLLVQSWQRREQLPADIAAELYAQIGFPASKDELLTQAGIADSWQVLGQRTEDDGQMRTQRTWLYGQASSRYALLLDFAMHNQTMTLRPAVGQSLEAEMVFYPSATPLRAIPKDADSAQSLAANLPQTVSGFSDIGNNISAYGTALAGNPWLGLFPFALSQVIPVQQDGQWLLVDAQQHCLPLQLDGDAAWILLGKSGGRPVDVFGEWDGNTLRFLGAFCEGEVL